MTDHQKLRFNLKADQAALDIEVLDIIGSGWYGGVSAADVRAALKQSGDLKTINVLINSPGGDAFEGIAIYNELKSHAAKVNVTVRGLAASAASIIAMAGDTITMNEASFIMIHRAMQAIVGNSKELDKASAMLDSLDHEVAGIYAARSGKRDKAEMLSRMTAETWYGPADAIDAGLADQTTAPADQPEPVAAAWRPEIVNQIIRGWEHAPAQVLKQVSAMLVSPAQQKTNPPADAGEGSGEGNQMPELKDLTPEVLEAECPDLIRAVSDKITASLSSVHGEAVKAAVNEERARCVSIISEGRALNLGAEVDKEVASGVSVTEAIANLRGAKLAAIKADDTNRQVGADDNANPGANKPAAKLVSEDGEVNEEAAKAKYSTDEEIRSEFPTVKAYIAYLKADAKGLVKRHAPGKN